MSVKALGSSTPMRAISANDHKSKPSKESAENVTGEIEKLVVAHTQECTFGHFPKPQYQSRGGLMSGMDRIGVGKAIITPTASRIVRRTIETLNSYHSARLRQIRLKATVFFNFSPVGFFEMGSTTKILAAILNVLRLVDVSG